MSFRDALKKRWFEILVLALGVLLLGPLGWVCVEAHNLGVALAGFRAESTQRLAALEIQSNERYKAIEDRLNKFEVKVPALAQARLKEPLQLAVVATKPVGTTSGGAITAVHVFSPREQITYTWVGTMKGDALSATLEALLARSDGRALSLTEIQRLSADAQQPLKPPQYINADDSWVFSSSVGNFSATLTKGFGTKPVASPMRVPITTSDQLINELRANQDRYEATASKNHG